MGEGTIEVLHPLPKGARFRHGVLDFDGTVSLIREGWQQIMIPYFTQELADTPEGRTIPIEQLRREAEEFRRLLETGKSELCTLEQGLGVVAVVDAARRAVRSGGWEHCPEIKNSMEEHQ